MNYTKNILDLSYWNARADKLGEQYRNQDPFPHIVLDNFLDEDVAREASYAFPGP